MNAKLKNILFSLSLVIISIVLFALFLEIIFRVYFPQFRQDENGMPVPDDVIGYSWRPNYSEKIYSFDNFKLARVHINSQGLRQDYDLGPKVKKRILVVGDSFTFGVGLNQDETFPVMLNNLLGDEWEVVNAGIWGIGTVQSILLVHKYEQIVDPDIVIYLFYPNDFVNNIVSKLYQLIPLPYLRYNNGSFSVVLIDKEEYKNYVGNFEEFKDMINSRYEKKSHVLQFLESRFNTIKNRFFKVEKPIFFGSESEKSSEYYMFLKEKQSYMLGSIVGFNSLLPLFESTVRDFGAVPIIVYIPPNIQASDYYQKMFLDSYQDIDSSMFDFNFTYDLFEQIKSEQNIEIIDLLPYFRNYSDPRRLYLNGDGHWCERGTALAANVVYDELKKKNLI